MKEATSSEKDFRRDRKRNSKRETRDKALLTPL